MASYESMYFGLMALAEFDGDPVENIAITREIQRIIVQIQVAEVRKSIAEGRTWLQIADAMHLPEDETRHRFEPLLV